MDDYGQPILIPPPPPKPSLPGKSFIAAIILFLLVTGTVLGITLANQKKNISVQKKAATTDQCHGSARTCKYPCGAVNECACVYYENGVCKLDDWSCCCGTECGTAATPIPTGTPVLTCSNLNLGSYTTTVNQPITLSLESCNNYRYVRYGICANGSDCSVSTAIEGSKETISSGACPFSGISFTPTSVGKYVIEVNVHESSACLYLCSAGGIIHLKTGSGLCDDLNNFTQTGDSCTSTGCRKYLTVNPAPPPTITLIPTATRTPTPTKTPTPTTTRVPPTLTPTRTPTPTTTPTGPIPTCPVIPNPTLTASCITTGRIRLSWSAVAGAGYYRLYRNNVWCANPPNTVTSFEDNGICGVLIPGTGYTYKLSVKNGNCESSGSIAFILNNCGPTLTPTRTPIPTATRTPTPTRIPVPPTLTPTATRTPSPSPTPTGTIAPVCSAITANKVLSALKVGDSVTFTVTFTNPAEVNNVAIRIKRDGVTVTLVYAAGSFDGIWTHSATVTSWSYDYTIPADGQYEVSAFIRTGSTWK